MEGQPKTSFIPKKPVSASTPGNTSFVTNKKKGKSVFSLIATIIFIATIAAIVAVFFYKFTLEKRIEGQVSSLEKARNEFDENFIKEATRLNTRINSATRLLDNHLSPSAVFGLLEENTLQSVSFSRFAFADTKDGQIQITGGGEAARFESIVLQSDEFGKSGAMRNVLFQNLNPNVDTGTIQFSFSASLDPRTILYRVNKQFDEINLEEN